MRILLSNASPDPIYEQILRQVRAQILSGDLKEGQALPSIRKLAQNLQISVITTKRAYDELEREGNKAVVVEYSVFKNRQTSMANGADVVIAVLAPLDARIERAVKSGWDETDVRNRIARQISDAERIEQADVVFNNDGTPDQLREKVIAWWTEYAKTLD